MSRFPLPWAKQAWCDIDTCLRCNMMDQCWSGSLQVEEWIHVDATEYYCPVNDQWTTLTLSPFSGCQFSITACESMLYLTGGGSLHDMQKEDSVFMYDIEGQVWKKAGSLPKALVDHASCMIKLSQVNATGEPGRGTKCSLTSRREKCTPSLFITKKKKSHSSSEEK